MSRPEVPTVNEAMPGWRAFTSGGPEDPDEDPRQRGEAEGQRALLSVRTLALVLALLGGCGAGAAVVLVAIVLLAPSSGSDLTGPLGASLGDDLAAAAVPADGLGGPESVGDAGAGTASVIVVDVAGAVAQPGLVRLNQGDRVGDAIAAAGGFAPRVDLAETGIALNLAQSLDDGAKVVVPELGGDASVPAAGGPRDGRIDLNSADEAALESLPGIGPVTAARIIDAREQQRFTSVDELRAREIVGESVFEDIRDLVTAG
jgi:competence protein ComEA